MIVIWLYRVRYVFCGPCFWSLSVVISRDHDWGCLVFTNFLILGVGAVQVGFLLLLQLPLESRRAKEREGWKERFLSSLWHGVFFCGGLPLCSMAQGGFLLISVLSVVLFSLMSRERECTSSFSICAMHNPRGLPQRMSPSCPLGPPPLPAPTGEVEDRDMFLIFTPLLSGTVFQTFTTLLQWVPAYLKE